jgi:hypothetical protein
MTGGRLIGFWTSFCKMAHCQCQSCHQPLSVRLVRISLTLHEKSFVIVAAGFAWPIRQQEGIHMIKLRKFLPNFGEDALLVLGLMVVFLGLYLLLAYSIIRF